MKLQIATLVLILSLVLSACGGATTSAGETQPTSTCPKPKDGYVCTWDPESQQWLYLTARALMWSQAWMILPDVATAEQIAQGAVYTTSYTLIAVLVPAGLAANPNLIRDLVQGPPTLRVGNTLRILNQDGSVSTIQLTGQITDADAAQDAAENSTANQNKQPKKQIAILNDDMDFTTSTIQAVGYFVTGSYNFVHFLTCDQLITGMANVRFDAYILDFNLADGELGSSCIPRIREIHRDAWIVLRSSDERVPGEAIRHGVEYQDTRTGSPGLAELLDGHK